MSEELKKQIEELIKDACEEYFRAMTQMSCEYSGHAWFSNDIVELPELASVIEDAKQFRKMEYIPCPSAKLDGCPWCQERGQGKIGEWQDKASKFDSLTEGLRVGKKCKHNNSPSLQLIGCPDCHGTGIIYRELTENDKTQVVNHFLSRGGTLFLLGSADNLELPSGARVVRGEK